MNTVYLYNQNLFWPATAKSRLKALLGREIRGPEAVFNSLQKGLAELGQGFVVNQKKRLPQGAAVCVLSGAGALGWAIGQKKIGKIGKIIAGPNVAITPLDHKGLLINAAIDRLVVPCGWVKEHYLKQAPSLAGKIYVWAAGVDVPPITAVQKDFDFLILDKIRGNRILADKIGDCLIAQNFKIAVLVYGKFSQRRYFECLERSKYLVYLSDSESQGLAMFEAWARNVPALVWDKEIFDYQGIKIQGNIASPYLNSGCGQRFKDFDDFINQLPGFVSGQFFPRNFIENNFTNKLCAQKYLDIVYGR